MERTTIKAAAKPPNESIYLEGCRIASPKEPRQPSGRNAYEIGKFALDQRAIDHSLIIVCAGWSSGSSSGS